MDLLLIGVLVATCWLVAVVAYSAGQRNGRERLHREQRRQALMRQRAERAADLRRELSRRNMTALYERMRNVEGRA